MAVVNETDGLRQAIRQPKPARRVWLAASAAWTALILFSSTSSAAVYCERFFGWIYGSIFGKHFTSAEAFDVLNFLAAKGLHLTLFLVLGILLWHVFTAPRWPRVGTVVLAGLIVGTVSELLQSFFPDRDPAIRDVVINGIGTLLGAVVSFRREPGSMEREAKA